MRGVVVLIQHLGQLAVVVLHPVTLVDDHVLPANLKPAQHACKYIIIHVYIVYTVAVETRPECNELNLA